MRGTYQKTYRKVIEKSGLEPSDIKLLIPHQASGRMIAGLASRISELNLYTDIDVMNFAPIETVFLLTSANTSYISSSIVRDVIRNNGDYTKLVPKSVVVK